MLRLAELIMICQVAFLLRLFVAGDSGARADVVEHSEHATTAATAVDGGWGGAADAGRGACITPAECARVVQGR